MLAPCSARSSSAAPERHRARPAAAHADAEWAKAVLTAAGLAAIPFIVKPIETPSTTPGDVRVQGANGKIEVLDAAAALAVIAGCGVPPTLFTVAATIKSAI